MKESTLKKLFAYSKNQCAFPECSSPIIVFDEEDVIVGEICHIESKKPKGPRHNKNLSEEEVDDSSNLILLCKAHHKIIDKNVQKYTVNVLKNMKKEHEDDSICELSQLDSRGGHLLYQHYIYIEGNATIKDSSINSITAKVVNIKSSKKEKIIQQPFDNSIGSDMYKQAYIEYLINRYNELAGEDKFRKTSFHYGVLRRNIVSKFGAKACDLPIAQFDALCYYLHERIDRTTIARMERTSGKLYHSFEEHTSIMNGKTK